MSKHIAWLPKSIICLFSVPEICVKESQLSSMELIVRFSMEESTLGIMSEPGFDLPDELRSEASISSSIVFFLYTSMIGCALPLSEAFWLRDRLTAAATAVVTTITTRTDRIKGRTDRWTHAQTADGEA